MLSFAKEVSSTFYKSIKDQAIEYRKRLAQLKAKHIPPYILALGSSLIIGLLSFGGVLALGASVPLLWPIILPLAFASFALSVVYEGEIYAQNIKGSFKKLKSNYLDRHLAKQCLLDDYKYTSGKDCPAFFKEYDRLCAVLDRFQHKNLDEESEIRKSRVEKKLSDMEKWFALQLFFQGERKNETAHQKEVRDWVNKLHKGQAESLASKWSLIKAAESRKHMGVKAFCVLAGLLMAMGTSYLLVGAFMVVPFLAALPVSIWPMLIAPMALLAGYSYGRLVHNAIVDMISNKILLTWYHKIRENFVEGRRVRAAVIVIGLGFFLALTTTLSICTAGTWWTVAKTTPALFGALKRMPGFIMLVLNPLISSVSIFLFNVQNISDTSEQIDEATKGISNPWVWLSAWIVMRFNALVFDFQELRSNENWFQIFNPIRLVIAIAYTPLRFLAFLGHILSIGVTADRVAGVSPFMSGALGAVNEGVEDVHYFVGHEGSGTCDLVSSSQIPDDDNVHALKMISKAAFVRVKHDSGLDCLYYVNKAAESADKRFIQIKLAPENLATFDHDMQPVSKVRMLSTRQVRQITALLPEHSLHDHDPKSLRRERLTESHGHSHEVDIPTQILDVIFWLPHRIAALWDSQFSRLNTEESKRPVLDYARGLDKQLGHVDKESVRFGSQREPKRSVGRSISEAPRIKICSQDPAILIDKHSCGNEFPSVTESCCVSKSVKAYSSWDAEQAIYLIERHKEKYLKSVFVGADIAQERIDSLSALQANLRVQTTSKSIKHILNEEKSKPIHNTHRFFINNNRNKTTDTSRFLDKLSSRVARMA